MTKTSKFNGYQKVDNTKEIEFTSFLELYGNWDINIMLSPSDWSNIMLLNCTHEFDIMYAWNTDPNAGVIYKGHWNSGVVND